MRKFLIILIALVLVLSGCDAKIADCKGDHVDSDANGACDLCDISVVEVFDFYAINDLHGKFDDTSTNIGVDELTTFLKNATKTDDNTIFLSSGDMWQGSSESNLTHGNIITEWMNELDFTAMTLGNHEYDWGEEYINKNLELAEFPFLAINVYDKETNQLVEYCKPSVMVEKNGVKIGIIGAIGDCYSSIAGEMVSGVCFKTGNELTELVKAESKKLRADGADFIVYSLHDGYGRDSSGVKNISGNEISSYYDIDLSRGGYVDLVFEGHTHKSYVLKDTYGVYHLQNGGDNEGISHVEVKINYVNNKGAVVSASFISDSKYKNLEDDALVDNLLQKYEDEIAPAYKVICNLRYDMSGNEIKNLVAKLYYEFGVKNWGDEYDIVLGGGYLNTRSPGKLYAGEVRYSNIQMVLPFDNYITLCSIKGSDLVSRFIENNSYYIYYGEYGQGVKNNIDPDKTYYVVVDSYSSGYAKNKLTEIARITEKIFARDLVAEYLGNG